MSRRVAGLVLVCAATIPLIFLVPVGNVDPFARPDAPAATADACAAVAKLELDGSASSVRDISESFTDSDLDRTYPPVTRSLCQITPAEGCSTVQETRISDLVIGVVVLANEFDAENRFFTGRSTRNPSSDVSIRSVVEPVHPSGRAYLVEYTRPPSLFGAVLSSRTIFFVSASPCDGETFAVEDLWQNTLALVQQADVSDEMP